MHDELAEFLDPRDDLQVPGERDALVGGLDAEEGLADFRGVGRLGGPELGPQCHQEATLQLPPDREQARVPLPGRIDSVEGAVVQLEAEVEGELEVVVAERVLDLLAERRDDLRR